MSIVRYNPHTSFDTLFDRLAGGLYGRWPVEAGRGEAPAYAPRVDIRDLGEQIVLSAELPGVDRDGLKIEVKDEVLHISGEKRQEKSEDSNGVFRSERVYGGFSRSFTLPDTVDGEAIEAAYKDGVLTIALPKRPEAAPRLIAIKEGKSLTGGKVDVN